MAWYHFIPGVGIAILAGETITKAVNNQNESANAVFKNYARPSNLAELKQRLNDEIASYNSKISLNNRELKFSKISDFANNSSVSIPISQTGQVLLQSYNKVNQLNVSFKENEIIGWTNAIEVRKGVLRLLDNPNVKFTFDVYDTRSYPLNATALKKSIVETSKTSTQSDKQKDFTIYLIAGGALILILIIAFVLMKAFK